MKNLQEFVECLTEGVYARPGTPDWEKAVQRAVEGDKEHQKAGHGPTSYGDIIHHTHQNVPLHHIDQLCKDAGIQRSPEDIKLHKEWKDTDARKKLKKLQNTKPQFRVEIHSKQPDGSTQVTNKYKQTAPEGTSEGEVAKQAHESAMTAHKERIGDFESYARDADKRVVDYPHEAAYHEKSARQYRGRVAELKASPPTHATATLIKRRGS